MRPYASANERIARESDFRVRCAKAARAARRALRQRLDVPCGDSDQIGERINDMEQERDLSGLLRLTREMAF